MSAPACLGRIQSFLRQHRTLVHLERGGLLLLRAYTHTRAGLLRAYTHTRAGSDIVRPKRVARVPLPGRIGRNSQCRGVNV